jgi:hypothetical protein
VLEVRLYGIRDMPAFRERPPALPQSVVGEPHRLRLRCFSGGRLRVAFLDGVREGGFGVLWAVNALVAHRSHTAIPGPQFGLPRVSHQRTVFLPMPTIEPNLTCRSRWLCLYAGMAKQRGLELYQLKDMMDVLTPPRPQGGLQEFRAKGESDDADIDSALPVRPVDDEGKGW